MPISPRQSELRRCKNTIARSAKAKYVIYGPYMTDAIVVQAQTENPVAPSKRGRPKQSKATNVMGRLRDYSDDVWRIMTQPNVPLTNNLAEQAVEMSKVK